MKHAVKYIFLTFLLLVLPNILLGQNVEMADSLRKSGKIYVVVIVTGIVFLGIVIYLIALDRKLRKLEKELKNKEKE